MKVLRCTILICFLGRGVSAQQTATVSGQLKDSGRVIANQTVKLVSENETFEIIGRGHTYESVTEKISGLILNNKLDEGWLKGVALAALLAGGLAFGMTATLLWGVGLPMFLIAGESSFPSPTVRRFLPCWRKSSRLKCRSFLGQRLS